VPYRTGIQLAPRRNWCPLYLLPSGAVPWWTFVQVISSAGLIRLLEAVVEVQGVRRDLQVGRRRLREPDGTWSRRDLEECSTGSARWGAHDECSLAKSIEGLLSAERGETTWSLAHETRSTTSSRPPSACSPWFAMKDVAGLQRSGWSRNYERSDRLPRVSCPSTRRRVAVGLRIPDKMNAIDRTE